MWQDTGVAHAGNNSRYSIIPALRYRDCVAAIDWLCRAFGFEKHAVYPNPDGSIAHAQLTFGGGMLMLGSIRKASDAGDDPQTRIVQPDEIGMRETQTPYLYVSDCDAVYASAKAAGAVMVMELNEMDYGGKAFTCRDPEGHLWHVGSYDPWSHEA
jgi:uncharacterized glyoxalase superfamily protein PhnB